MAYLAGAVASRLGSKVGLGSKFGLGLKFGPVLKLLPGAAAAVTLAALIAPVLSQKALAAELWPASVKASYVIDFNGFNIGTFEFDASVHGKTYVLSGDANISALLGVINWRGVTRTSGRVRGVSPKPAAYTFEYRSGAKGGAVSMGFKRGRVSRVSAFPALAVSGTIPLQPKHLNGVLDPLSALMAMTKAKGSDPCARRLPIFDGKQRFDLILSYAGRQRIRSGGRDAVGYVCSVRYRPIAGYKRDAQTVKMANSTGLKIVLQPISGAKLLVPYQITIPTVAGPVTITSKRISVSTRGEHIALVN